MTSTQIPRLARPWIDEEGMARQARSRAFIPGSTAASFVEWIDALAEYRDVDDLIQSQLADVQLKSDEHR
ncbi:MAG: hypothetical protein IPF79_04870 [Ignavibacteria bacterium]|nr:hypothetical protein [Ignavibacteria bacterium]